MNIIDEIRKIDNTENYRRFLEIEAMTCEDDFLYEYMNDFFDMLSNESSYIRVRGFRMICSLSKWDKEKLIDVNIEKILSVFDDDLPTSIRQYLKAINQLLLYKTELSDIIKNKLLSINYSKYKDSMSGLIKKDIDSIIKNI